MCEGKGSAETVQHQQQQLWQQPPCLGFLGALCPTLSPTTPIHTYWDQGSACSDKGSLAGGGRPACPCYGSGPPPLEPKRYPGAGFPLLLLAFWGKGDSRGVYLPQAGSWPRSSAVAARGGGVPCSRRVPIVCSTPPPPPMYVYACGEVNGIPWDTGRPRGPL